MDDKLTPAGAIRRIWGWLPVWVIVTVIAFAVIGGVIIGGQKLGFWLDTQNIHHQQNIQKSQNSLVQNAANTQQGYIQAVSNDVTTLDGLIIQAQGAPNRAMLISQAIAVGDQACLEASYLTGSIPEPAQMTTWIYQNCSGGTMSPSAITAIRKGTGN